MSSSYRGAVFDWLGKNKVSVSKFARMSGIGRTSLYSYFTKKQTPNLVTAIKIVVATKGDLTLNDIIRDSEELSKKLDKFIDQTTDVNDLKRLKKVLGL